MNKNVLQPPVSFTECLPDITRDIVVSYLDTHLLAALESDVEERTDELKKILSHITMLTGIFVTAVEIRTGLYAYNDGEISIAAPTGRYISLDELKTLMSVRGKFNDRLDDIARKVKPTVRDPFVEYTT